MSNINNNKIFVIDGNIGSGKSTFIKYFENYYSSNSNIIFLLEPISEWESLVDSTGKNILQFFYSDKSKYSFSFQTICFITRYTKLLDTLKNNHNSIIVCERSLYSDKNIFAKMLFDTGFFEEINYNIYLTMINSFLNFFTIDKFFYINTSPDVCLFRINKRQRLSENTIDINYLILCDTYHKNFFKKITNLVILDGNIDVFANKELFIHEIGNN